MHTPIVRSNAPIRSFRRELPKRRPASNRGPSADAAKLLQTQEDERRRIGRELHDGVNQKLAVLVFEMGRVAQRLEPFADLQNDVKALRNLASELIDDVRELS